MSRLLLRFVDGEERIGQLRDGLSDFSHRCRNLLNGMKMSMYILSRSRTLPLPCWWSEMEDNYKAVEQVFDTLQRIYRPMTLTTVRTPFGSLVRDRLPCWRAWMEAKGGRLVFEPPDVEAAGELDPNCLTLALDEFVRWRARCMRPCRQARLLWQTAGGEFQVRWIESSSGEPIGAADSSSEAIPKGDPIGADLLVVPLLARVLTAHGGSLQVDGDPEFQAYLRWPLVLSQRTESVLAAP